MAGTAITKAGFPGIEIHGRSMRVAYMYKGARHRHSLGMEPTKNNIKHAAGLRCAALFALKTGNYNEADFFPHTRATDSAALGNHCVRFAMSNKDPDPLSYEEYDSLINKGCLHPIERAAVTLAVYTGLRPGELLALAIEDVAPDLSRMKVRRSITESLTFKVPKTNKERTVLLFPPARDALKVHIADAEQRKAADLQVWLNRHESRLDRARVLLSPRTQARRKEVNDYFVPSAWNTKWASLVRRAKISPRPPYQTRHTFSCWNLTAQHKL